MKHLFIHSTVVVIISMVFSACSSLEQYSFPKRSPEELGVDFKKNIVGTWRITTKGEATGFIKTFNADGTAKGVISPISRNGNLSVVLPDIQLRSKWRVKGDICEVYNVNTENKSIFTGKEIIRDKILFVSPNKIIVKGLRPGSILETAERLY